MFELIGSVFYLLIYQPLLNALFILYRYLPGNDFGVAVITLTFGIRFLLYPLTKTAIQSQKALSELQPKLKEIQECFKNDKERQAKETFALYREAKVNPFASVLPFLVQLPILFALFRLFGRNFGESQLAALYPFLTPPSHIDFSFLGMFNLGEPNILFAVGAGILQFVQTKTLVPAKTTASKPATEKNQDKLDMDSIMQKQMLYFFPLFTVVILLRLPSALALYWMTTTIFSIGQQYLVMKHES